ncbi:MAG: type II toxin-antitoxin system VapC family toxin, partial [Gammaproteobacteria bacterium]
SVAIKWLVPFRPEEADVEKALALFDRVIRQDVMMAQPPHFVAEIMAVIARLEPDFADSVFNAVSSLEMIFDDRPDIYRTGIRLSIQLSHHLFDTLYHAVALNTTGAVLITADEVYYRKAQGIGQIMRLQAYTG